MQDGDSVSRGGDVEHERPADARHLPTRPRTTAVLDGYQRTQLLLDAGVVAEAPPESVVGCYVLDPRFGPQAPPALRVRSEIVRRQGA